MRLFIAIGFPSSVRKELRRSADTIRSRCVRGSFTSEDNIHLTLCFLGETAPDHLSAVIEAMRAVTSPPVPLTVGSTGRFRSRSGDTIYRSVEAGEELYRLQRALSAALKERGIGLDERPYTPHLTVARRAVIAPGVTLRDLMAGLQPLAYTAREITLFRSEQTGGRRVYTPLFKRSLE